MATIRKRRAGDGSWRYTAVIRWQRKGRIIHQEARTFSRMALAEEWARRRELALEQPGALDRRSAHTLAELIERYRREFSQLATWQRSKEASLLMLQNHEIGQIDATTLTAARLVDHVRQRRLGGAGPATVGNDLIWIGVVLKAARGAWGLPVEPACVVAARETCRALRLIARPQKRSRRPTANELKRLYAAWDRKRRLRMPMADIVAFAVASARRQEEIGRLEWADLNEADSTILVRDVKHPRAKQGNHRLSKLTAEALAIIRRQRRPECPASGDLIFPHQPKTVSALFTRTCALLGIADLHFHDLRHEATSRLFEAGYSIPEMAMFTLHESWQELKRYTNMSPQNLQLR